MKYHCSLISLSYKNYEPKFLHCTAIRVIMKCFQFPEICKEPLWSIDSSLLESAAMQTGVSSQGKIDICGHCYSFFISSSYKMIQLRSNHQQWIIQAGASLHSGSWKALPLVLLHKVVLALKIMVESTTSRVTG